MKHTHCNPFSCTELKFSVRIVFRCVLQLSVSFYLIQRKDEKDITCCGSIILLLKLSPSPVVTHIQQTPTRHRKKRDFHPSMQNCWTSAYQCSLPDAYSNPNQSRIEICSSIWTLVYVQLFRQLLSSHLWTVSYEHVFFVCFMKLSSTYLSSQRTSLDLSTKFGMPYFSHVFQQTSAADLAQMRFVALWVDSFLKLCSVKSLVNMKCFSLMHWIKYSKNYVVKMILNT